MATGSTTQASLTFSPSDRAVYYEVAILDESGNPALDGAGNAITAFTCQSGATNCVAVTDVVLTGLKTFALPLTMFPATGRYRFQLRAIDANGTPGAWSAMEPALGSAPVTVGGPAPVGPVQVASSSATGATIKFPPVWLAESYEVEVIKDGTVVGTVVIPASAVQTCAMKATGP